MHIEVEREVLTIEGGDIGKIKYFFYSSMNIYEYKNKIITQIFTDKGFSLLVDANLDLEKGMDVSLSMEYVIVTTITNKKKDIGDYNPIIKIGNDKDEYKVVNMNRIKNKEDMLKYFNNKEIKWIL